MAEPIDFYFDFSSPYAFFAHLRIDGIAARHGRDCRWHPILLGVLFRNTGMGPLTQQPLRGDYARRDWDRLARRAGIAAFRIPEPFPLNSLQPSRAFYWLNDQDPALAKAFTARIFSAYFERGRDVSQAETVADEAKALGIDHQALLAALADPHWKERLRQETEQAMARGVFGSPFVLADGEPFWGNDRLADVDQWLEGGGW